MNLQNILVPVDFSTHSQSALQEAAELARKVGGSITLLYVAQPVVVMQGELPPVIVPLEQDRIETLQKDLAKFRAFHARGSSGQDLVLEGSPWPTICETAEKHGVDLIVLASHGYTGIKRMLLGSTAEQVVRHAHCPVMVIKAKHEDK